MGAARRAVLRHERRSARDLRIVLKAGLESNEVLRGGDRRAAIPTAGIGPNRGPVPLGRPNYWSTTGINLKTAKAIGLTIPSSLLRRADQVIE